MYVLHMYDDVRKEWRYECDSKNIELIDNYIRIVISYEECLFRVIIDDDKVVYVFDRSSYNEWKENYVNKDSKVKKLK